MPLLTIVVATHKYIMILHFPKSIVLFCLVHSSLDSVKQASNTLRVCVCVCEGCAHFHDLDPLQQRLLDFYHLVESDESCLALI